MQTDSTLWRTACTWLKSWKRENMRFIWEAVIPWADLSSENTLAKKNKVEKYTPAAGDVLSCNFVITDISYPCPGTEYIPQMAWCGSQKIDKDPSLWGSVTLAE